jgi:hypothetical protein
LPLDINKSKYSFSIDSNGLRIGFSDVKGVGPISAQKLVENQPYTTYSQFNNSKNGLGEKTKQIFASLGALDGLQQNIQSNLFGESIPEFKKLPMSFSERFNVCPWDLEFGVENKWLQYLIEHSDYFKKLPTPIANLKESNSSDEVVIYGIVYDKNLRDAREVSSSKGKEIDLSKYNGQFQFANFVLEDDTDFITVRLSHKKFPEYGNLIFEETKADDVVIVKGRMGSGIRMFFADKIINLRKYKEEKEKSTS